MSDATSETPSRRFRIYTHFAAVLLFAAIACCIVYYAGVRWIADEPTKSRMLRQLGGDSECANAILASTFVLPSAVILATIVLLTPTKSSSDVPRKKTAIWISGLSGLIVVSLVTINYILLLSPVLSAAMNDRDLRDSTIFETDELSSRKLDANSTPTLTYSFYPRTAGRKLHLRVEGNHIKAYVKFKEGVIADLGISRTDYDWTEFTPSSVEEHQIVISAIGND